MASLFLAGCAGVPLNNWPGLTVADGAVFYSQVQLTKIDAATGSQIWRYPDKVDANNTFFAAPAVVGDKVIAGNLSNVLVALDTESRNVIWTFNQYEGKGRFLASPVVENGVVLVPSTDSHLYALDVNSGTLLWRFKTREGLWAPVASDGTTAYLVGMDHYLYAIDIRSGNRVWEIDLDSSMLHAPVLGEDGMLYLSTINQEVIAVDTARQRVAWRESIQGKVWSPVLVHEGKVFFGTDTNKAYALDAQSGNTLWTMDAGGGIIASPVVLGENIAFGTETGEVFTASVDGVRAWPRTITGKIYSSVSVSPDLAAFGGLELEYLLVTFNGEGGQNWSYNPPQN